MTKQQKLQTKIEELESKQELSEFELELLESYKDGLQRLLEKVKND